MIWVVLVLVVIGLVLQGYAISLAQDTASKTAELLAMYNRRRESGEKKKKEKIVVEQAMIEFPARS
jgi:outer membrane lipoprotein-sorting protein